MSTNTGPTRRAVPLPETDRLPRVGKIRLGEAVPTGRNDKYGSAITRPVALDHFRVVADESGITSAEAAESFTARYGEAPTVIRAQLAGATPDAVMEGAWRLYGTGKLKRKCDGTECDERTATGGWNTLPCVCAAKNLAADHKDHCKLSYTLNLFLPDVRGFGVWQVETGSEISVRRMVAWLRLLYDVRAQQGGDLWLVEFELALVPVQVAPDGKAKTVHVLDPRTIATPREVLTAGVMPIAALEAGPENPPPAADEDAEALSGEIEDEGEDAQATAPAKHPGAVLLDKLAEEFPDLDVAGVVKGLGMRKYGDLTEAKFHEARAKLIFMREPTTATDDEDVADAAWAAAGGRVDPDDETTREPDAPPIAGQEAMPV